MHCVLFLLTAVSVRSLRRSRTWTSSAVKSISSLEGRRRSDASINKVAIVGSGAAGLVTAKVLLDADFQVILFEKNPHVGGVWKYQEESGVMYKSLRTNLPRELMSFWKDYPFEYNKSSICNADGDAVSSSSSYATHYEVQSYLEKFSEQFSLHSHIQFSTEVLDVRRIHSNVALRDISDGDNKTEGTECSENNIDNVKWQVQYTNVETNAPPQSAVFDAVIVCNGHYEHPFIPNNPFYTAAFTGKTFHASDYDRIKHKCKDRSVLVIGSKSSGTDMARELSSLGCIEVHVSDRNLADSTTHHPPPHQSHNALISPCSITVHPAVVAVEGGSTVRFTDGSMASNIDVVVWCTGYKYDYPFLDCDQYQHQLDSDERDSGSCSGASDSSSVWYDRLLCRDRVSDRRVRPLYEQLFHTQHPTLAFVGLPYAVVPFPMMFLQAQWIAAAYRSQGAVFEENSNGPLPGRIARMQWLLQSEEELDKRGMLLDKYHFLGGNAQWEYCRAIILRLASGSSGDALPFNHYLPSSTVSMLKHVDLLSSIYWDNSCNKPPYTGAPDSYRDRRYTITCDDSDDSVPYTWTVRDV